MSLLTVSSNVTILQLQLRISVEQWHGTKTTTSVDKSRTEYKARLTGENNPSTSNSTNQPVNDYLRSIPIRSKLDQIQEFEVTLSTTRRAFPTTKDITLAISKDPVTITQPTDDHPCAKLITPTVPPLVTQISSPKHQTIPTTNTILHGTLTILSSPTQVTTRKNGHIMALRINPYVSLFIPLPKFRYLHPQPKKKNFSTTLTNAGRYLTNLHPPPTHTTA